MSVTPGVGQPNTPVYAVKPPMLTLAVVSLCFGIAGVLMLWVPFFGWSLGIVAVLTGHVAVSHIKRSIQPRSGKGLAIGGLVTGYFATVVGTGFFIVTVIIAVVRNH
ncbi:DUF4190 domain-containing protein [Demequina lutea]|uniref:DUF4190 domain-containing protein n=1 Tax=Demequina lutea TaxID=431489 RepID=A0A7Z0CII2_9MICO|nr:DUF4190 domain-containing protein [Demequina lutea]NYI42601.1 hypothetical protein [Demequina lutea]